MTLIHYKSEVDCTTLDGNVVNLNLTLNLSPKPKPNP